MSREDFTRIVTTDQPDAPAYFTFDAILNTRERPTLDTTLEKVLHPLSLDDLLSLGNAGAQILDVREAADFAKGYLAGSINIGLGGQYATWAGTLLDPTRPIVIIAEPGREQEASVRLGRIGFDNVKGYLRNGMESLVNKPELLQSTRRVSAPMLAEEMSSSHPPVIVDIRTPSEWNTGHITGSINLPLSQLQQHIDQLPRDRVVAVHCAGGYRSSIAASLLALHGVTDLIELAGGMAAWETAKLPVIREEAARIAPS
jgi:hydroxyacylglutathione hydrolase